MPRPPIDRWYRDQAETQFAEGWKPGQVYRLLERKGRKQQRDDYPSESTVRNWHRAFLKLPEEERQQAALFHWPQSMLAGALPWEASESALTLLRYCDAFSHEQPTVRLTRWFWRVLQARPDLPTEDAYLHARWLALWEHVGDGAFFDPAAIAWELAYTPWRSDRDAAAYAQAQGREHTPLPPSIQAQVMGEAPQRRKVGEAQPIDPEILEHLKRGPEDAEEGTNG